MEGIIFAIITFSIFFVMILLFKSLFKQFKAFTKVLLLIIIISTLLYYIFPNENLVMFDKIVLFVVCLSLSLIICFLLIALLQKSYENKIIRSIEKQYHFDNFEYYRDILKDNDPGILSVCYNFKKVKFTDLLICILLNLQLKGKIKIHKDHIQIIDSIEDIKPYERKVIGYIKSPLKFNKFKRNFYNSLLQYARDEGYIINENKEEMDLTYIIEVIEVTLVLTFIILGFTVLPLLIYLLESKLSVLLFLAYALVFISIPIYKKISSTIHPISRTQKALTIAGKLQGLKHFIQDFSNLNNENLKSINLYDEYVIYCILFNIKGNINDETKKIYKNLFIKNR